MSIGALPPVYIVSATRTPIGAYMGSLSAITAPNLGATAIKAALERAKVAPNLVNEVLMGNVLTAGIGQAPARQAMRYAGLPDDVPAVTIGKVCGSGLQALIFGAKSIALGDAEIVVAGGMESMSNVPYYLREGPRGVPHGRREDHRRDDFRRPLGSRTTTSTWARAATSARRNTSSRAKQQDDFAEGAASARALAAQKEGLFDAEIAEAVSVPQRKGDPVVVKLDEGPAKGDPTKMAGLRPAFGKDGTITAANASSINDGASALVLASEAAVKKHGLTPLAKIQGWAAAAQAPEWFTTAPAKAMDALFTKLSAKPSDFDLVEINEAFAVVAMVSAQLSKIDIQRVNTRGGAVALGHPIGASGARIVTTLLHALRHNKQKRGLASICIGGGEALAIAIETV